MKHAARKLTAGVMLAVLVPLLVCVSSVHYGGFLIAAAVHLWIFEPAEIWLAAMIGRAWKFGKGGDAKDGDEKREASETGGEPSRAAEK